MSMFGIHFASIAAISKIISRSIIGYDADILDLCNRLIIVSENLDTLLSSGRDDEDIENYDHLSQEQAQLIEHITKTRTFTIAGMIAKAECALLKPIERGYDGGINISISICRDLLLL